MKTGTCGICSTPIEENAYGTWRSSLSGSEKCLGGIGERHELLDPVIATGPSEHCRRCGHEVAIGENDTWRTVTHMSNDKGDYRSLGTGACERAPSGGWLLHDVLPPLDSPVELTAWLES